MLFVTTTLIMLHQCRLSFEGFVQFHAVYILFRQLKLQQQNLHLGPPSMLIPGKRIEDSGTTSEDDGLPCSPPEMSFHERVMHGAVYKVNEYQRFELR